jgi:excinuclease ABC subunit B
MGRAARHVNGRAILYADKVTGSIDRAVGETNRRRAKQLEYNVAHGITPQSIRKAVTDVMEGARSAEERGGDRALAGGDLRPDQGMKAIKRLEAEMYRHARNLEFEEAARIRDQIERLREATFGVTAARTG